MSTFFSILGILRILTWLAPEIRQRETAVNLTLFLNDRVKAISHVFSIAILLTTDRRESWDTYRFQPATTTSRESVGAALRSKSECCLQCYLRCPACPSYTTVMRSGCASFQIRQKRKVQTEPDSELALALQCSGQPVRMLDFQVHPPATYIFRSTMI